MSEQEIEELKAIINIIPTDIEMELKIHYAIELFRSKHPKIFNQIVYSQMKLAPIYGYENLSKAIAKFLDNWRKKAGYR